MIYFAIRVIKEIRESRFNQNPKIKEEITKESPSIDDGDFKRKREIEKLLK